MINNLAVLRDMLRVGLKTIDDHPCPARRKFLGDNPCPRCRSHRSEGCGEETRLVWSFLDAIREAVADGVDDEIVEAPRSGR